MRLAALVLVATMACSKPEPPTIVPEKATVTAIRTTGVDMRVQLRVQNPNNFALTTPSMQAKVVFDNRFETGTVTMSKPVELAAASATPLDVPLTIPWSDLAGVSALAAAGRDVPYRVQGSVRLGGKSLNVEVPFEMGGTLTRAEFQRFIAESLQGIFPK